MLVLCVFSGDDGLLHISVFCKLLAIHVLLKGSRLMGITGHEFWTIGTVVLKLLAVAL